MSWHYLQEQEEACWPHACLDGAPDVLSRLIPTLDKSSSRDNATGVSNGSRYGTTSRPSTGDRGEGQLTLFRGDSPAKILAQRVKVADCPESVRDLFSRCSALLTRFNLALSSRKTVRFCVPVDLAPSSSNLTGWGIVLRGACWELGTSAHLIDEIECGSLLPTPTANQYGTNVGGAAGRTGKVRESLDTMARKGSWPTPNARDWKDSGPTQGNRKSPNLGTVVHNWPTPKATDADRGGRGELLHMIRTGHPRGSWPTPTAGDAKGSGRRLPTSKANAGTSLTDAVNGGPTTPRTGKLNPSWVESYLMGWPLDWTATRGCEPLGMDRFRAWLLSHGTF